MTEVELPAKIEAFVVRTLTDWFWIGSPLRRRVPDHAARRRVGAADDQGPSLRVSAPAGSARRRGGGAAHLRIARHLDYAEHVLAEHATALHLKGAQ